MPSRVAETVLWQEVVIGAIVPSRTDTTDIRGAESLGKPALLNFKADFPHNILYAHFPNFTKYILLEDFRYQFPKACPESQLDSTEYISCQAHRRISYTELRPHEAETSHRREFPVTAIIWHMTGQTLTLNSKSERLLRKKMQCKYLAYRIYLFSVRNIVHFR